MLMLQSPKSGLSLGILCELPSKAELSMKDTQTFPELTESQGSIIERVTWRANPPTDDFSPGQGIYYR